MNNRPNSLMDAARRDLRRKKLVFAKVLLVFRNMVDLFGRGGRVIEAQLDPLIDEFLCEFEANDPLAEAQDLGVVGQDAALDAIGVVGGDSANALDFVGGDGDAQASAADQESAIGLEMAEARVVVSGRIMRSKVDGSMRRRGEHGLLKVTRKEQNRQGRRRQQRQAGRQAGKGGRWHTSPFLIFLAASTARCG